MQHHRAHLVSLPRVKPLLPPEDVARYSDAAVKVGLSLRKGDDLIVLCQPAHREFAAALVDAAYRAGARTVDVVINDPVVRAARLRAAPPDKLGVLTSWQAARFRASVTETTASLLIAGESEPGALDGIPAERIAEEQTAPLRLLPQVRRAARAGRRRWGIMAWPVPAWAQRVYPKLSGEAAQRKLARDLLWFCRIGPDDPPGVKGLRDHLSAIQRRARRLTQLKLRMVELRGPGTELTVALHADTLWSGGGGKNGFGIYQAPNLPTEECFTSPEASATEGTFRCSRPLMFQGRLIEGIAGEFRSGRLVRLKAKGAQNQEWLADFLHSIDGADRLGEVALVDSSSRIGQAGRIYYNTLLDENAAAHIAFGSGFQHTRKKSENERGRRGVNRSRTHLDVMIGTDDLEATGVGARGRRVPLIRDGTWQV
jgi:aminopeptidase